MNLKKAAVDQHAGVGVHPQLMARPSDTIASSMVEDFHALFP